MQVTFIKHSCFFIESESFSLLFDYVDGVIPGQRNREKPLFVFASHRHGDHFSPKIPQAVEGFKQVFYILSDDIPPEQTAWPNVWRMKPYDELKTEFFTIKTLRSTDEGVAFLLNRGEKWLYHAGDLNCWKWEGEPLSYNQQMEDNYRKELQQLAGLPILAAFVPLDPRQDAYYDLGMAQFLQAAPNAHYVFPMHMWGDYDIIRRYESTHGSVLQKISRDGQVFVFQEDF